MNQIFVNVRQLQIVQGPLTGQGNMLRFVVGIPQLARHKQVFSLAESIGQSLGNTLADLRLVTIIAGTIEASIARLDGVVANFGADLFRDLPKAKDEGIRSYNHGESRLALCRMLFCGAAVPADVKRKSVKDVKGR